MNQNPEIKYTAEIETEGGVKITIESYSIVNFNTVYKAIREADI